MKLNAQSEGVLFSQTTGTESYLLAPASQGGDYQMIRLIISPDKLVNLSKAFQCFLPLIDPHFNSVHNHSSDEKEMTSIAETPARNMAALNLISSPTMVNQQKLIPGNLKSQFIQILNNAADGTGSFMNEFKNYSTVT